LLLRLLGRPGLAPSLPLQLLLLLLLALLLLRQPCFQVFSLHWLLNLSISDNHDRLRHTLLLLWFACSTCCASNRLFTLLLLAHAHFSCCCCPHRWCHAN
jgi:hypothetical protein